MTATFPYPPGPDGLSRRSFLRRAGLGTAVGATAVLLPGCSSGSDGSGDPVTFLNILPLESLTFTPEMVADAGGHFVREGLDVSFQVTRGSAQAIQTIIAGSALVTRIGDVETMLAAGPRNAPLVNVGTALQRVPIRIVSAASNPIRTPADFPGKTIGIPSEGGTSETTLDLTLSTAEIPPANVSRQVVGLSPGTFDLVVQGRIAAYVVSLDVAETLRRQRPEAVVFDPGDVIASGAQVYATSRPQLEEPRSREVLARYLRAIRSAMNSVLSDPGLDRTLETIRSQYDFNILASPEDAKASLRSYVANWTAAGPQNVLRTVPERWNTTYRELVTGGLIPPGLDPARWFTNELVPA